MINYELYIGVFWHELAITVVLPFRAVSRAATSKYIANTLSFLAIACIRNMNMIKQTLDTSTMPVQRNCNIFLKLHLNLQVQQYCLHLLQATYPSNFRHSKDNLVHPQAFLILGLNEDVRQTFLLLCNVLCDDAFNGLHDNEFLYLGKQ